MLAKIEVFNKQLFQPHKIFILSLLAVFCAFLTSCETNTNVKKTFDQTKTFAGFSREFGEPYGIAVDKTGTVFVSDGDAGKIFKISVEGKVDLVSDKFDTPSAIVFDKDETLIIADSGSHTIKRLNPANGEISTIAGTENKKGFADGEAANSLFNAPIGVAVNDGKIYVADTYNDKIRLIENGKVSTIAGNSRGFFNGTGNEAKFDTPGGIAILFDGSLLIADTGNSLLRRIELDGKTTTFAGTGEHHSADGFPLQASFVQPTAVSVDESGVIYVADGNSIRAIGRRVFPFVETISATRRGFADGSLKTSMFNRPSGIASDGKGNLFVTDAENQVVRVLTNDKVGKAINKDEIAKLRYTAKEFRELQKPRWTYDPPQAKRDISGTLGEVRGEIIEGKQTWFHNGLDIAGGYGEKTYFIRSEKVLKPMAAENFGDLRELLRLPTMGYIHLRLGRDSNDKPFEDPRFQFDKDEAGKLINVRVPRGTKFESGDLIGTLNRFNHVHLIAGRTGMEMNALDALILPDYKDTIAPKIDKVFIFDENWNPLFETINSSSRISLSGKIRLVVQAFDRMDGNPERRKLGVYKLGYQILKEDKTALFEPKWTISFEKMPEMDFVNLVYAKGSKSGYTPETIFNYIVTNEVNGDFGKEGFLDFNKFEKGNYILRILVSDFTGNISTQDIQVELR